jgi:hypothetical protein
MIFLFTKSNKIGSRLIRWATNGRTSHFSIGFDTDTDGRGLIIHSHFRGVHLDWFNSFIDKNEVVMKLRLRSKIPLKIEDRLFQHLLTASYGKKYDIGAFLFFALDILKHKIFRLPRSSKNLWQSRNQYLCVEIYKILSDAEPSIFPKPLIDLSIATPDEVYSMMLSSNMLEEYG